VAHAQEIAVSTNGTGKALNEAALQKTRERIAETAGQIEERVKTDLNWQTWVKRYPLRSVGLAIAAGALAGLSLGGRRKSTELVETPSKPSTLMTSVLSTVATIALREGAKIVAERLIGDKKDR
jgi:ElaB/YqjD/DUF883 family membrane-anchored ribosome-binding protein